MRAQRGAHLVPNHLMVSEPLAERVSHARPLQRVSETRYGEPKCLRREHNTLREGGTHAYGVTAAHIEGRNQSIIHDARTRLAVEIAHESPEPSPHIANDILIWHPHAIKLESGCV